MSKLSNIRSVAKYESKLLMRSWFYRIFLILAILFLCLYNATNLVVEDFGGMWIMRSIPSNIPYVNLLLLNMGQAVIAVFLSSEFLKTDKKLDTSEVFYVHPLSNAEYVIGKIWGNINVFFRLDLIIIAIVVTFNFVSGVHIDWVAYVTYFFLICIPTLVFIFGLSVGLMLILKNQAITFVLLLGYIALTLFYIGDKLYYLFDYMVYYLPMVKSTVVGFSNTEVIINQRLIYLFIGLGFICISIFLFRRLPNDKYGRYRWLALSMCFILAGCFSAYKHVSTVLNVGKNRTLYTEVNNKYVQTPKMIVNNYNINIEQHPGSISSEVEMTCVALENSSVFTFCLNPGMTVREIKENGKEISHERDNQIILVNFGREVAEGDTVMFTVKYDGSIDESFCYLDIPDEIMQKKYTNISGSEFKFNIDKKYSFQSDNYLLFTPETYWYPRPGTSYSSTNSDWQQNYFSSFRLVVKPLDSLKVLSQGAMKWPLSQYSVAVTNSSYASPQEGFGAFGAGGPGFGGRVFSGGGGRGGFGMPGGGGGGGRAEVRMERRPGGAGGGTENRSAGGFGGASGASGGSGERAGGRANRRADGEMAARDTSRIREGNMRGDRPAGTGERVEGRPEGRPAGTGERAEGRPEGRPEGGFVAPGGSGERVEGRPQRRPDGEMAARDTSRLREGRPEGRPTGTGERAEGRPEGRPEGGFVAPGGSGERVEGRPERRPDGEMAANDTLRFRGGNMRGVRPDSAFGDSLLLAARRRAANTPPPLNNRDSADIAREQGVYIFETDFLTPSLTLIIGDYKQKGIDVDGTHYNIWYLNGHDYFSAPFDSIIDTIPSQLRERRRSIETAYSLDYSFKRFSVIEVPVQLFSYVRTWTQAQEKMQPEMVLYPEKGCLFNEADVLKRMKLEKVWASRWGGREITDKEAAINILNNFAALFSRSEINFNMTEERGVMASTAEPSPYFIFPQLYNFRYNIFSSEWPIANRLIEIYLQDKTDNNAWLRQVNGISNTEKANLLMERYDFKELLADMEHRDLLDNVISLKINDLFALGERNIGNKEYRDSLRDVLKRNIFKNVKFEDLLDTMGMIANEDFVTPLDKWNYPTKLPLYVVGTPEIMRITNRDKEVYVVKFQVTNDSDNDGIVNIDINTTGGGMNFGGGGGMRMMAVNMGGADYDPRAKRKVSIAANETKNFVSVWDEAPRGITINTLLSANLPNIINLPANNIIRERNKPIDEEGDFIISDALLSIPGEIIVDNEDSTLFSLSLPDVAGLLPKWLEGVGDNSFRYSGVVPWRPPLEWTLTTNDKYYGTHIRSAYVVKSGKGSQTATWKIPVPDAGYYDLFYYYVRPDDMRGGNRGGQQGNGEYRFKVKYDDGDEEKAYINLRRANEGWSQLGSYYFNKDTVEVVLSNHSEMRTVIADAVKIVKK